MEAVVIQGGRLIRMGRNNTAKVLVDQLPAKVLLDRLPAVDRPLPEDCGDRPGGVSTRFT